MSSDSDLVWIFCKGDTNLNVAIRDNKVILVPADPKDETQVISSRPASQIIILYVPDASSVTFYIC